MIYVLCLKHVTYPHIQAIRYWEDRPLINRSIGEREWRSSLHPRHRGIINIGKSLELMFPRSAFLEPAALHRGCCRGS